VKTTFIFAKVESPIVFIKSPLSCIPTQELAARTDEFSPVLTKKLIVSASSLDVLLALCGLAD